MSHFPSLFGTHHLGWVNFLVQDAITVDLPEPDSPTTATFWPRCMLRDKPCKIFTLWKEGGETAGKSAGGAFQVLGDFLGDLHLWQERRRKIFLLKKNSAENCWLVGGVFFFSSFGGWFYGWLLLKLCWSICLILVNLVALWLHNTY